MVHAAEDCGNCDVCLDPPEVYDGTEDAQKALSAVYRLREGFGMGHVIDVLRGAQTDAVLRRGHDQLSVYGIGAEYSRDAWGSIIRQLIHRGYLIQDIARYSVLKLTPAAGPVLRAEEAVVLARPRARVARPAKVRKAHASGRGAVVELATEDEPLFERLRDLRRTLAAEQKVPAYVVFSDATLVGMATVKPQDTRGVPGGVGGGPDEARAVWGGVPGGDCGGGGVRSRARASATDGLIAESERLAEQGGAPRAQCRPSRQ